MRYYIYSAFSSEEMIEIINKKLLKGWKPIGGVTYSRDWSFEGRTDWQPERFCQAMINEDLKPLIKNPDPVKNTEQT